MENGNLSKLSEIIVEIGEKVFVNSKSGFLEPLELSDKCKLELGMMDYKDKIKNILNKYCEA